VLSGQGADTTIECPDAPTFTPPTAKDACDPNPAINATDNKVPGSCPGTYSMTRTWTAVDCAGNVSAPVSQTITVKDTKAPTLSGQGSDTTIECPDAPSFTAPTAKDACDPKPTVSSADNKTAGTCPGTYSIT